MRTCAKMRCGQEPVVTVSLAYTEREVVVADLLPERDPNLLDLCRDHVDRMTPPRGLDRPRPPPGDAGRRLTVGVLGRMASDGRPTRPSPEEGVIPAHGRGQE